MMTLDFPSNAKIGDLYQSNGITYVWNGHSWQHRPPSITQAQTAAYVRQESKVEK